MIGLITNRSIIITDLLFRFYLQNVLIHLKINPAISRNILVVVENLNHSRPNNELNCYNWWNVQPIFTDFELLDFVIGTHAFCCSLVKVVSTEWVLWR